MDTPEHPIGAAIIVTEMAGEYHLLIPLDIARGPMRGEGKEGSIGALNDRLK